MDDWSVVLDAQLIARPHQGGWLLQRPDVVLAPHLKQTIARGWAQAGTYRGLPVGFWVPELCARTLCGVPRQAPLTLATLGHALYWLDWPQDQVELAATGLLPLATWLAERKQTVRGEEMAGGRAELMRRLLAHSQPTEQEIRQWEVGWYRLQKSGDRQLLAYVRAA